MDYPQILSPIINFLHCPTPQAWIDEARKPENLPLLLTDHMVCETESGAERHAAGASLRRG
ncbi:tRNA-(ms[2]io[6]A)-hydroxylase [Klebsiella variicola]|uniref:tRNA-(Ms[2]io[6]A)-hydroxylase n=1 Tax=Klebsiella variicola TaxID=244366 RepID=A0A7H4MC75_KLEVA|nr:tRNA-(ms[2]io[6]A)-hydroxylase [Klebsiella variicola]